MKHISYTFLTDLHSISTWIKMFFSTNLRYPVENIMENALAQFSEVVPVSHTLKKNPL